MFIFTEFKDIVPYLAAWGALLSTYLFFQAQIDRRKKLKAEHLVKINIVYSAISWDSLPYAIGKADDASLINTDIFFPFHFTVTNHSDFSVQITSAAVIVWDVDCEGKPKQGYQAVPMGIVGIGCLNDTPNRHFELKSRESVSIVPVNKGAFFMAQNYMKTLGSNLLLLPRIQTSTDGWFQGSAIIPMGFNDTYDDNSVFTPVASKYRIRE